MRFRNVSRKAGRLHADYSQEDDYRRRGCRQNEKAPPCRLLVLGSSLRDVCRGLAQWSDEAITAARERLDKARRLGRVAQGRPKSLDRRVQTVLEVDVGIHGPEPLLQFVAGDHLARAL